MPALTVRASSVTPSRLRTTPKMAARLSMLGLPFFDSMRWRLFAGAIRLGRQTLEPDRRIDKIAQKQARGIGLAH